MSLSALPIRPLFIVAWLLKGAVAICLTHVPLVLDARPPQSHIVRDGCLGFLNGTRRLLLVDADTSTFFVLHAQKSCLPQV
jgi:hypothetical protein